MVLASFEYLRVIAFAVVLACGAGVGAETGIRPWSENPWYWSYNGEPVLLLGASDDDNLFQWRKDRLVDQLDRLEAAGGNVIRNTMSDRPIEGFEQYPFRRLDNGKYDLREWNDSYWDHFETMLRETAERRIFVQIEVWDRFDYTDLRRPNWRSHPYNPANNVNYSAEQSGFAETYAAHPAVNEQPFFFTPPGQRDNRVVLEHQQRFVDKLLSHTLGYGHVLYCIDNETVAEEEWARYWANYIREHAAQAGKPVYLTEMWDDWNLRAQRHRRTFDHPELYDFVDVSQNNHNKGKKHWDNFLYVRNYLSGSPRPINTTKTYGADGNKFGHTDQDAVERFWRHLLAGAASARFHRPPAGIGLCAKSEACLRAARLVEERVPFWTVNPAEALLSGCDPNEAYAAADPGNAYLVYFPTKGEVTIDLDGSEGPFTLRWIDIDKGAVGSESVLEAGPKVEIETPGPGNWVAVIIQRRTG